ncbi:MAG: hypothetical protein P8O79_06200 [Halieaceae bacterium]|nr:hypothetical protein [Halieaceae bacterium]
MRPSCLSVALLAVVMSMNVFGQAFCELRNPNEVIGQLVPKSVTFESEVLTIDEQTRRAIVDSIGVDMHHQELGYHTLYRVWDDNQSSLGMVHVRPEATPFGLMEIAWMIDTRGRVVDFTLQRCRSRVCSDMDDPRVHAVFYRRDLMSLMELFHSENNAVDKMWLQQLGLSGDQTVLFTAITKSAIKTLAVLDYGNLLAAE